MIYSLATPFWISGKYRNEQILILFFDTTSNVPKVHYFDGSSLGGSVSMCTSGCDDDKLTYYATLANDWCSESVQIMYFSGPNSSKIQSVCNLFTALSISGAVLIVFEMSAFIGIVFWMFSMLCSPKINNCFFPGCCCSIWSCTSHYIAVIFWLVITNATFGSCYRFSHDDNPPTICARTGPILGITVMAVFPFGIIGYLIVFYVFFKKNKEDRVVRIENPGPGGQNVASQILPTYDQMPGFIIINSDLEGVPYGQCLYHTPGSLSDMQENNRIEIIPPAVDEIYSVPGRGLAK